VALSKSLLQLGARFLSTKDPDEAQVKGLINGLEGIYVKHFTFRRDGVWNESDLDQVRNQLKAPEWSRIVGVKSTEENNTSSVSEHENGKVTGVAILAPARATSGRKHSRQRGSGIARGARRAVRPPADQAGAEEEGAVGLHFC